MTILPLLALSATVVTVSWTHLRESPSWRFLYLYFHHRDATGFRRVVRVLHLPVCYHFTLTTVLAHSNLTHELSSLLPSLLLSIQLTSTPRRQQPPPHLKNNLCFQFHKPSPLIGPSAYPVELNFAAVFPRSFRRSTDGSANLCLQR